MTGCVLFGDAILSKLYLLGLNSFLTLPLNETPKLEMAETNARIVPYNHIRIPEV